GPGPCPVWIDAETGRILRAAALNHGAGFGPGARIKPIAAERGTVVAQPGEAGELLTRFDSLSELGVGDVGEGASVDLLRHFGEGRIGGVGIIPGGVE